MALIKTKDELRTTHDLYDEFLSEWKFYIASYFGGKRYRDGDYLIQHPFESDDNYTRRKDVAYYYNYCQSIIDVYASHLYRKKPSRDFGGLTGDTLFESFLEDADLESNTFHQFMKDAQRFASAYGRVSIIVDKPPTTPDTLAEAEAIDARPYLVMITPENLLDWSFVRDGFTGRLFLESVKIFEDGLYRIWTTVGWELWAVDDDDNNELATLIDSGEHNLGIVPMVNLFNVVGTNRMLGVSDIQDISSINKNIYSQCSNAGEIIANTAFPMLAQPMTPGGDEVDENGNPVKQVGPRNIMEFDPEAPNAKPYWLEAPHSSLTEIREWIHQDIVEIHRIAKMGGIRITEDSKSPRSGISREYDHLQLYSLLNEKAENAEHAETQILKIWALWQEGKFDGKIDYPNEFSVKDLDNDIDNAIKENSIDLGSSTFKEAVRKKTARTVLPKESDDTLQKVDQEIEESIKDEIANGNSEQIPTDTEGNEVGDSAE